MPFFWVLMVSWMFWCSMASTSPQSRPSSSYMFYVCIRAHFTPFNKGSNHMRFRPTTWPHFNLIISVKTLSLNEVTFCTTGGYDFNYLLGRENSTYNIGLLGFVDSSNLGCSRHYFLNLSAPPSLGAFWDSHNTYILV